MNPESRYNRNTNLKQIAHSNKYEHDKEIVKLDNKYHGKCCSVFIKFKKPCGNQVNNISTFKSTQENMNLISSTLPAAKFTRLSMY